MRKLPSGKFVLRISPELHAAFQEEATTLNFSLNELLISKLTGKSKNLSQSDEILTKVQKNWSPLAIIQFGSSVRGDSTASSDIDWLIVLDSSIAITRSLYTDWDTKIQNSKISPQFVHLPLDIRNAGGLWLEVALEGQIITLRDSEAKQVIYELKNLISMGYYQRKWSHGHPYWVKRET